MRSMLLVTCLTLLMVASVFAQVSEPNSSWAEGPEGFLLTDDERSRFEALQTDGEVEEFIGLFWARRDPDLGTFENEREIDFTARVEAADMQFGEPERRGALSDRGQVLILLGLPSSRYSAPIASYLADLYGERPPDPPSGLDTQVQMRGIQFDGLKGVADVWEYTGEQIAGVADIDKLPKSVTFAFFDTQGTGSYELAKNIRKAKTALDVMEAIPPALVASPDLLELPSRPLIQGEAVATAAQLEWLAADSAPWPEGAQAALMPGVALEDFFPAWLFLGMPTEAPAADLMVGRLTGDGGVVEGTFQIAAAGIETKIGRVYELMVPAAAGRSKLEVALVASGHPIAVTSLTVDVDDVVPETTYISPFFVGGDVIQEGEYIAGTPFEFGGYHLILRPEGVYQFDENIEYFSLVVYPGLNEVGEPDAKIRIRLKRDGTQLSSARLKPAVLSKVAPNVYMFGSSLPLSFLKEGGDYELGLTLKDGITGVERKTEYVFHLPEK